MSSTHNSSTTGGTDTPITNFSQCHVGIISHLDTLVELPTLLAPAQQAREVAADML